MKKILLFLFVFTLIQGYVSAQNLKNPVRLSVISGKDTPKESQPMIYMVADGKLEPLGVEAKILPDGSFEYNFTAPYEGFYTLDKQRWFNHRIWLDGGDKISLRLGDEGLQFEGNEISVENRVLSDWQRLIYPIAIQSNGHIQTDSIPFSVFFTLLESFIPQAQRFADNIDTGNRVFDEAMKRNIALEIYNYAIAYLYSPRSSGYVWPERSDYPPLYDGISARVKLDDDFILTLPYGGTFINNFIYFMSRETGRSDNKLLTEIIGNPRIIGMILPHNFSYIRSPYVLEKELEWGAQYLTEGQLEEFNAKLDELRMVNEEQVAVDFTFPDVDGNMISLSDFKGKVVLIDVWATWCGPCLAQLPHLLELKKRMEDTDLVIMGISVDKQNDYDKWAKMVRNGDVKGIQLFSGGGFPAEYNIRGIPRFIVFGRDGQVAEIDAPRPSQPYLEDLLRNLIEK